MILLKEDGEMAGLDDVLEWFLFHYPKDIFVTHEIAMIRDDLERLLKKEP